jgi:2-dehydro-3-deoxyphosphogluconate aldolase/(4S)-4-hydroxy-2-oxoglutarate aldolase
MRAGDVLATLSAVRVLPVATVQDIAVAVPLARSLVEGGLPLVEVTLRSAAGLGAIAAVSREVPDAIVGAGTVTTAAACEAAIDLGARFIVSPGLVEEVVAAGARRGVPVLPGVATPTELLRAVALGCTTVKLFPAGLLGGPAMVRALVALGVGATFVPTGGIDHDGARGYLEIPEVIAVGGSWMLPGARVADGDWTEIRRLAAACADLRRPPASVIGDPAMPTA